MSSKNDPTMTVAKTVLEALRGAGHFGSTPKSTILGAEIERVDGVYLPIELDVRHATGTVRISCGGWGNRSHYRQRKDGSHDLSRLVRDVEAAIALDKEDKKKVRLEQRSTRLVNGVSRPKCVVDLQVKGGLVTASIKLPARSMVALLAAITHWESSAALEDPSAEQQTENE